MVKERLIHLGYDPVRETLADYPAARCIELVRAAIGRRDVARGVGPTWRPARTTASTPTP